uniref:Type II toxin-antitoxin system Phd/YefM family antitoxin n=1 Tax=Rhabditophanes sp. KR3021 TaxID=114890 RepID=A0AC35TJN2_9BILA
MVSIQISYEARQSFDVNYSTSEIVRRLSRPTNNDEYTDVGDYEDNRSDGEAIVLNVAAVSRRAAKSIEAVDGMLGFG